MLTLSKMHENFLYLEFGVRPRREVLGELVGDDDGEAGHQQYGEEQVAHRPAGRPLPPEQLHAATCNQYNQGCC